MPRITRWFPVSHDINSDPESWELTDRFGVSGLRVWLEILSIADRNDGVFGNDWEAIKRSLSIKCNTTQRQVSGILELTQSRSWIGRELPARVVNYAKYHNTRGTKKLPSEPSEPSEPSYPNHKKKLKVPDGTRSYSFDFERAWKIYPNHRGSKRQAFEAWKKANLSSVKELQESFFAGLQREIEWRASAGAYNRVAPREEQIFVAQWPHCVRWIKGERWLQEFEALPQTRMTRPSRPLEEMLAEAEVEREKREARNHHG